ncbi:fungal specific transcription factor [Grosmannia clavigera kw1407]|uniref:Fungal specific transcription factor n=1 Tax=Grosmannia clavigera (strain kw1407 / UAMH 11150) TaxID=655863 RepID=F0XUJ3_GROCL|nr:fungal specific transcription factor [Grosmannia clavigera kw1407]EFW98449.1 fungal specific transcription factor [Grosmannia clavigera kw1407]
MRRIRSQLCPGNRSACDRCHAKKLKCSRLTDELRCSNCEKDGPLCIHSPPLEGGRPRKCKLPLYESRSEQTDPPDLLHFYHAGNTHLDRSSGEQDSMDGTAVPDMNWNNAPLLSDLFWRPWLMLDSPPTEGDMQPESFGEPDVAFQHDKIFGFGEHSQHASSKSNNNISTTTSTTASMPTTDLDRLLGRLAGLQQQLMLAKSALSPVAVPHQDGDGLFPHGGCPRFSGLAAMEPALRLAHAMLAVAMPATLTLDLYRDALQRVTSELQPQSHPNPWAVTPSGRSNSISISPTPSSLFEQQQQQAQRQVPQVPQVCLAEWSMARLPDDLKAFISLATLQYYLVQMEQATAAGEQALSPSESGGLPFIALSIQQLASTVRNIRDVAAQVMHRVLHC